jgi:hypothetical protein
MGVEFSQEIADTICERIANGESLRSICANEDMPSQVSVFRWLAAREEFCKQYALAREAQADALFDEMLDIADDGRNDWMATKDDDGESGWRANGEHIQRSKLRLDARKWMASKLQPKKYGDKIVNEHTGADGGAIETVTRIERVIVRPNSPDSNG